MDLMDFDSLCIALMDKLTLTLTPMCHVIVIILNYIQGWLHIQQHCL